MQKLIDDVPHKSVSLQMQERFERRRLWRRFVAVVYITMLVSYLFWRYTIINPHSLVLSVAYYIAECIGFVLGLKAIFNTWNYSHRTPLPAPKGLTVDIFLPVYKEPLEILRRTIMAARNIKYPHQTIVLDDGKRDELRALAAELGVGYLRRPDNTYAKAGNLNYGLQHSAADFVMAFDADHIALPHALDIMLGFFDDKKTALVQTPQDYYNIDAFQYINSRRTGALWHDQSLFYSLAQPSADSVNAAECVGTGVVYRRSALDHIGGIPVETVTEDTHTSLKLHKAGYRTVYLNEPVAYGLAAADLSEYYKTRHRWGHGNLHALRTENILFCKGLSLHQRLHYFFMGLIYLEGWQQLLLFTIPVMTLCFGLQPFTITIFNALIVLAFPFLSYLLLQEIGCGFARYWANEIFSMARWPVYLAATAGLFGGKMSFKSSTKSAHGHVSWKLMAPQLAAMTASLIALAVSITRLAHTGFQTGPLVKFAVALVTNFSIPHMNIHEIVPPGYTVDLVALSGAWALYCVVRVTLFVYKALQGAKQTHDYFRFRVPIPVVFQDGLYGCITSLSEDWVSLAYHQPLPALSTGDLLNCTAFMPAGPLPLKIRLEHRGDLSIEGHLIWDNIPARDKLANSLYSVDWHREFLHRHAYFMTPSDVVLSCLCQRTLLHTPSASWRAILFKTSDHDAPNNYGIISGGGQAGGSMICFDGLDIGAIYDGLNFTNSAPQPLKIRILGEEGLHSLATEGLDGAVPRRYTIEFVA